MLPRLNAPSNVPGNQGYAVPTLGRVGSLPGGLSAYAAGHQTSLIPPSSGAVAWIWGLGGSIATLMC